MRFEYTFRNLEYSKTMLEGTQDKFRQQLSQITVEPVWVDMIFSKIRDRFVFRSYIFCGDGASFYAKSGANTHEDSVDQVLVQLTKQITSKTVVRNIWWSQNERTSEDLVKQNTREDLISKNGTGRNRKNTESPYIVREQ